MATRTVTLFLALLAVIAEAVAVVPVVVAIAGRWGGRLAAVQRSVLASLAPHALGLALAIASVATAGSLYLSEVAHFPPCRLCWYQRISMYPLVPILAIAVVRRDHGVRPYTGALAVIGMLIASYHVLLERFPSWESGVCEAANPCTLVWVRHFGYLTIPAMALSGFAAIAVLSVIAGPDRHRPGGSDRRQP